MSNCDYRFFIDQVNEYYKVRNLDVKTQTKIKIETIINKGINLSARQIKGLEKFYEKNYGFGKIEWDFSTNIPHIVYSVPSLYQGGTDIVKISKNFLEDNKDLFDLGNEDEFLFLRAEPLSIFEIDEDIENKIERLKLFFERRHKGYRVFNELFIVFAEGESSNYKPYAIAVKDGKGKVVIEEPKEFNLEVLTKLLDNDNIVKNRQIDILTTERIIVRDKMGIDKLLFHMAVGIDKFIIIDYFYDISRLKLFAAIPRVGFGDLYKVSFTPSHIPQDCDREITIPFARVREVSKERKERVDRLYSLELYDPRDIDDYWEICIDQDFNLCLMCSAELKWQKIGIFKFPYIQYGMPKYECLERISDTTDFTNGKGMYYRSDGSYAILDFIRTGASQAYLTNKFFKVYELPEKNVVFSDKYNGRKLEDKQIKEIIAWHYLNWASMFYKDILGTNFINDLEFRVDDYGCRALIEFLNIEIDQKVRSTSCYTGGVPLLPSIIWLKSNQIEQEDLLTIFHEFGHVIQDATGNFGYCPFTPKYSYQEGYSNYIAASLEKLNKNPSLLNKNQGFDINYRGSSLYQNIKTYNFIDNEYERGNIFAGIGVQLMNILGQYNANRLLYDFFEIMDDEGDNIVYCAGESVWDITKNMFGYGNYKVNITDNLLKKWRDKLILLSRGLVDRKSIIHEVDMALMDHGIYKSNYKIDTVTNLERVGKYLHISPVDHNVNFSGKFNKNNSKDSYSFIATSKNLYKLNVSSRNYFSIILYEQDATEPKRKILKAKRDGNRWVINEDLSDFLKDKNGLVNMYVNSGVIDENDEFEYFGNLYSLYYGGFSQDLPVPVSGPGSIAGGNEYSDISVVDYFTQKGRQKNYYKYLVPEGIQESFLIKILSERGRPYVRIYDSDNICNSITKIPSDYISLPSGTYELDIYVLRNTKIGSDICYGGKTVIIEMEREENIASSYMIIIKDDEDNKLDSNRPYKIMEDIYKEKSNYIASKIQLYPYKNKYFDFDFYRFDAKEGVNYVIEIVPMWGMCQGMWIDIDNVEDIRCDHTYNGRKLDLPSILSVDEYNTRGIEGKRYSECKNWEDYNPYSPGSILSWRNVCYPTDRGFLFDGWKWHSPYYNNDDLYFTPYTNESIARRSRINFRPPFDGEYIIRVSMDTIPSGWSKYDKLECGYILIIRTDGKKGFKLPDYNFKDYKDE